MTCTLHNTYNCGHLKLLHKVDWSWWWVLSPLWIGAALGNLVLVIVGVVAAVRS